MSMVQNSRGTAEVDENEVGGNCKKGCHTGTALLLGPLCNPAVPENATFNGKLDVYW